VSGPNAAGARIRIRVRPGASKTEIVGVENGFLVVRLAAPPVEGKANDALCRLLAKYLGVPRSGVEVVRGRKSREKTVQIGGMTEKSLLSALNDLL
jgi:uncharacterized protein (TIGR00251 family)